MLKIILCLFLLLWLVNTVYGLYRPLPAGISMEGDARAASDVGFYYDLTYAQNGRIVHEQSIFEQFLKIVAEAEQFIVLDMFLFNDEHDKSIKYPTISAQLVASLLDKKKSHPQMGITLITDEINTCYGSYKNNVQEVLKENNIDVIMADTRKLRDSNGVYSGLWRLLFQWFGVSGHGWLPNPFAPDSPDVSLLSYFKLLNFKANHRKVIVTEKAALITSANPHDAGGWHSNIAFVVKGDIVKDVLASERAVAAMSGSTLSAAHVENIGTVHRQGDIRVRLLTEGKIRDRLLDSLAKCKAGDDIQMGMFYLAEEAVLDGLLAAARRGVNVRLVLDVNREAFGRKKNGIPNRLAANFLARKSNGRIKIRWYETHGEQFHTKLIWLRHQDGSELFGGSANLTRRNIGDFNLESDLHIEAPNISKVVQDVSAYFERIRNNDNGQYTVDFSRYKEESFFKARLYRFQEWSGMSTF